MLGIFSCFNCLLLIFFSILTFKRKHVIKKQVGSRSGPIFIVPAVCKSHQQTIKVASSKIVKEKPTVGFIVFVNLTVIVVKEYVYR